MLVPCADERLPVRLIVKVSAARDLQNLNTIDGATGVFVDVHFAGQVTATLLLATINFPLFSISKRTSQLKRSMNVHVGLDHFLRSTAAHLLLVEKSDVR